jgi:DNA invertase Pin-like site-specific DNA recombinase
MNPFRNSKTRKKRSDSESILSDADVRAILASSGTYSELAKLFMVSVTTISNVKRRVVRANVPFDGEVAKSSSPRGRKPKGTL